ESEPAPEILARAGFLARSEARVMVAAPGGEPGGLSPEQEEDPRETAKFVAEQFFARSNPARRDAFARAIAHAPETRLLSLRDRAGIVGAMMLSATSDALGVYNLCVAPRKRGAGVGTELVRWVLAHSPIPVTLQCDIRLESWYRKVGFRSVGALRFFGLASARDSDTI
ncbi:N-acetyltransferase, partial [bacterium]